jgi:hypothetical protein
MPPFIILAVICLLGLVFVVLFAGRQRKTDHGVVDTPAPGSPDSPVFGEPDKSKAKR